MRYVALLRGINVGGKAVVPIADLRLGLEGIGLKNVRTLLNSGNAVFQSDEGGEALEDSIGRALEARFGFRIPALVRSAEEVREVVNGLPFSLEEIEFAQGAAGDAECLYIVFLSAPLSDGARGRLDALKRPGETVRVSGRAVYLLLEHSIRACRLFSGWTNWTTGLPYGTGTPRGKLTPC